MLVFSNDVTGLVETLFHDVFGADSFVVFEEIDAPDAVLVVAIF